MKKKLIFYIAMSILMVGIAISTFFIINGFSNKYETNETKAFKEVLTLLEKSRNSNKKGYEIKFKEDFNYNQKTEDDEEVIDYKSHYLSEGLFNMSYEVSNPSDVSFQGGFESFFKNANGFISGTQIEKYEIENVETSKKDNSVLRNDNLNKGIDNTFIIDNDSNNVSVMSVTLYNDFNNKDNNVNDKFYGKISKNVLMDNVETKSFNTAVDKMMFVDVWDSTNTLLLLMHNTFVNFELSNSEKIFNYIKDKSFTYNRKDKTIEIKYMLSLDGSLKEEENNFNDVEILIEVDNESGEIVSFKFDLSKYLSSLLALEAEGATYFKADVNSYYIEGKIINNTLDRADTSSIQYKEYNDETKYDFIDQFINHAIPTREDIY